MLMETLKNLKPSQAPKLGSKNKKPAAASQQLEAVFAKAIPEKQANQLKPGSTRIGNLLENGASDLLKGIVLGEIIGKPKCRR